MQPGYSLHLFMPFRHGKAYVGDITDIAHDWSRSIRLQGGYWTGTFTLRDKSLSSLQDIYYNCMGGHLEEHSPEITWQGAIFEMTLDEKNKQIDVVACGYIHYASWQHVAIEGGTANASTYIQAILETHCAEFLRIGRIRTNTLQVLQNPKTKRRAWDEMQRIVELGDENGNPWRLYCDNYRYVYYEPIDPNPIGFVRTGVKRRRSYLDMANYVTGTYTTDDAGETVQTLTPAVNQFSIDEHGRREADPLTDGVPQETAEAMRDTVLKENAYPWPRPVGAATGIEVYDMNSNRISDHPWMIQPGVYRDMSYPTGGETHDAFLQDARDFLVDEVSVTAGRGVSLRTHLYNDVNILEAVMEEAAKVAEYDPRGAYGEKRMPELPAGIKWNHRGDKTTIEPRVKNPFKPGQPKTY